MCLFAAVSILAAVSCKKQDETTAPTLDANNMMVPQEKVVDQPVTVNNATKKPGEFPIIKITEPEFDFGTINAGDKVEHTFKFINTGKSDLIIANARPTCGCTVPDWTKVPVKPGESGEIKIVFNSTGKKGNQHKNVNLTTNTESGNEVISFKANVIPSADKPKK